MNSSNTRSLLMCVVLFFTIFSFQNCGQNGTIAVRSIDSVELATQIPDPVTLLGSASVTINDGNPYTNSQNVMLQLKASGAEEMFISNTNLCNKDTNGKWEPYTENKPWKLNDTNSNDFVYVVFRKKDAPESECVHASILHDNLPPQISVQQKAPPYTSQTAVKIAFTATDSGSGVNKVTCKNQDGAESSCSDSFSFSDLSKEGSYSVTLTATDLAGNQSLPVTESLVVDRTAPTIMINGPQGLIGDTSANFSLTVVESNGLDSVLCRLSPLEADFKDCSSLKVNYTSLNSVSYALTVKARDKAGNESQTTQSFQVDLSVPSVQLTQTPDALGKEKNVVFAFTGKSGSTPITKFKCSIDNTTATDCTSPKNIANLTEGNHTFSVVGTNAVGKSSAAAEFKFIVDLTPPTLAITQGTPGVIKVNSANLTLQAQDANGIKSVLCSLQGGAYTDCSSQQVTYSGLKDGSYTLTAKAIDKAGNESSAQTSWIVDTTPDSLIRAQMAANPVLENTNGTLNIELIQVTQAAYSCVTKTGSRAVASGPIVTNPASVNFKITEDTVCTVLGLDKASAPIQVVVNAVVDCGNRIKSGNSCVDYNCKNVIKLTYTDFLNMPIRDSIGTCYAVKLFDRIENTKSSLTINRDSEVISRNHDAGPTQINPYALGKALIEFKLAGPRTVKLAGGLDAQSPIKVDNYVLVGLYPKDLTTTTDRYKAYGTKDSTIDAKETSISFRSSMVGLTPFASNGTATLAPLEIVNQADVSLNYILDIRALDCGGARELSDIYLLFQ